MDARVSWRGGLRDFRDATKSRGAMTHLSSRSGPPLGTWGLPVRLRRRHRYGVRLLIHTPGRVARLSTRTHWAHGGSGAPLWAHLWTEAKIWGVPTVRFFQTENQSSKPSVSFGNLAEGEEAFILGHARPQGRPHSTSPPTNGIARCSKQAHQLNTRHDTT